MSPTFQYDLCMKTSSLIESLTMCAVVNVDYQVGSHRTPLDKMRIFIVFKLLSLRMYF